jgi:hypothetical protein
VLLRLAYLGMTNALAILRLLPVSDHAKDTEILALRHQITVLQRQLHGQKVRFDPCDRAFLAALLHRLPRDVLILVIKLAVTRADVVSAPAAPATWGHPDVAMVTPAASMAPLSPGAGIGCIRG